MVVGLNSGEEGGSSGATWHMDGPAYSRGGTYLTKINFLKFFRQFHMVIYVG